MWYYFLCDFKFIITSDQMHEVCTKSNWKMKLDSPLCSRKQSHPPGWTDVCLFRLAATTPLAVVQTKMKPNVPRGQAKVVDIDSSGVCVFARRCEWHEKCKSQKRHFRRHHRERMAVWNADSANHQPVDQNGKMRNVWSICIYVAVYAERVSLLIFYIVVKVRMLSIYWVIFLCVLLEVFITI